MDSVTYGINFNSVLNDLEHFHVANNQLPQDIMHILLEGVIPYTMSLMLHSFIFVKSYFTLNFLNERIFYFKFSRTESADKPCSLTEHMLQPNSTIHQTGMYLLNSCMCVYVCMYLELITYHFMYVANQMWNLAVYLPLIIGDQLPDDDTKWECFLILLDVLQICMSRVQSTDLADYLGTLIEMYLQKFRECYPTNNIIPKQHYLVHLPSQILK